MDFWRAAEILGRRKWLIILSVLVAVTLTWAATRLIGARWTATIQFMSPDHLSAMGAANGQAANEDSASSPEASEAAKEQAAIYAAIVKSRDVTEPVLKKMDQTQLPPDLLKNIDFVASGPRLFQLQVTDTSMTRAGMLANSFADQFVQVNHDLHTEQAQKAMRLLAFQLDDTDTKLAQARSRYESYRNQHQIIGNVTSQIDAALTSLRLARQNRDLVISKLNDAQARLLENQRQTALVPPANPFEFSGAAGPLPEQIHELAAADQDLTTLRTRYTDQHPLVQQALAKRNALKTQLQGDWSKNNLAVSPVFNPALGTLGQEARSLRQEVAGSEAQLKVLNSIIAKDQADLNNFKGTDSPLAAMAGTVAELSEGRNNMSARLNNARLALDVAERQSPITILDHVNDFNPPLNMTKGRTLKLILLAALAALVGTSALLVALDSIDRRLRTVKQAEIVLPRGILAVIPQPMAALDYSAMARITELHPRSLQSEAYRFLAMHLLGQQRPTRSLMVLSAKAEQGSTTTITNLGITLAQAGKRVVIVDANIRTSELHTVFGVANDFGFTNLLQDPSRSTLEKALQATSVPGLQYITSGPAPENPWELFRSQNLLEMSRLIHEEADYILYDTASSLMFTDALNLSPIVDAAILCVRALEPLTGAEERLVESLEGANVAVLGSVLSDVPASLLEGFHNYQMHYRPALLGSASVLNVGSTSPSLALLDTAASLSSNGHR